MSAHAANKGDTTHIDFILNAFSNMENGKINWDNVAKANSIGYARNATTKFKDIVKKYGYKYDAGGLVKLDAVPGSIPIPKNPFSNTPGTPKTSRKKKSPSDDFSGASTPASNKKRKVNQPKEDDDDQAGLFDMDED